MKKKKKPVRPYRKQQRRGDDTFDIKETCTAHHCAGHRMLVVIGSKKNKTIDAALRWALQVKNVNHLVWFKTLDKGEKLAHPYLPNAQKNGWRKYAKPKKAGKKKDIVACLTETFQCCCFLDEMMIMTHGSPSNRIMHKRILEVLPDLCGGRPIKKLVLWMCNASLDIYPDASFYGVKYFNEYCSILAPRKCPCHCDPKLCVLRCQNPEGKHPKGYHCPDSAGPAKLYLAGWHREKGPGGKDLDIASILGIQPGNATAPLTSPDGRIREVTITDKAKTDMGTGKGIFNGMNVRADKGLTVTEEVTREYEARRKQLMDAAAKLVAQRTKNLIPGSKAYKNEVKKVNGARDKLLAKLKRKYKDKLQSELNRKTLTKDRMKERTKDINVKPKKMDYTGPKCTCPDRDGCLSNTI